MSYINDALKKAQGEKDSRYVGFGGILQQASTDRAVGSKRLLLLSLVILVVLMAAVAVLSLTLRDGRREAVSGTTTGAKVQERRTAGTAVQASALSNPQDKAAQTSLPKPDSAPEPKGMQAPQKPLQPGPGAEALYESALKLQRVGRNTEAAMLYERVLVMEPGHVKALNNLGVILMGQKRRGRAAEMLGKAIAIKGDYIDPYYNLACLYAQAGDHAQSLRYLKAALAISREVRQWAAADADLKPLQALPEYRKMMEEKQ
jgi:tetratricopeptide (TPR) repeat protein